MGSIGLVALIAADIAGAAWTVSTSRRASRRGRIAAVKQAAVMIATFATYTGICAAGDCTLFGHFLGSVLGVFVFVTGAYLHLTPVMDGYFGGDEAATPAPGEGEQ